MFKAICLDLDGTLLNGTQDEINEVINYIKGKELILIYATARPLEKLLQVAGVGKKIPIPDFFLGNDGNELGIRKNKNEVLMFDGYKKMLIETTGFNKREIKNFIAQDFQDVLKYYEFFATDLSIEYAIKPGICLRELETKLLEVSASYNIGCRFIFNSYPIEDLENIDQYTTKEHADYIRSVFIPDYLYTKEMAEMMFSKEEGDHDVVHIVASDKGYTLNFVSAVLLGIDRKQIITCGDTGNDISLVRDFNFIQLGNANRFLNAHIKNNYYPTTKTKFNGAAGILDGLKQLYKEA